MIVHVVEQGSEAWLALRIGIPTASEFDRIITPKTGKLSAQARPYAIKLVAEAILGESLSEIGDLKWVQRGKELEPEASQLYEFELGVTTSPVGFITSDDGRIGASPDRLVDGIPAAVELKCPAPHTQLAYVLDGFGTDYKTQVQGQMLVGDFEWVDRYAYHPALPPMRVRTYRDEAYIKLLRDALDGFLEMRDRLMEQALAAGAIVQAKAEPRAGKPFLHTIVDPMNPAMADFDPWGAS